MMPPLELDYCRSGVSSRTGAYVLAAALAFAAHVGAQYLSLREDVASKEARLSAGAAKRAARPAVQQPIDAEEYAFAGETIRRLSTPWGPFFRALESANTERVALLAIEPNVESRTVTLTGEARDYLVTLTYVARLAEQEPLKRVHLVRHEMRRDVPRRPIVFTISAGWKDDG
jgi:hypothetical protein